MIIRLATEKDIELLIDLWLELMEYHTSFSFLFQINHDKRADIEKQFMDVFPRQDRRIYVAESDGNLIGMLMAKIDQKPEMFIHRSVGYIGETIVTKNFRGQNIGNALVDAAHVWFKSKGVDYFELQVAANNESSVAFWKSKGYEVRLLRMTSQLLK